MNTSRKGNTQQDFPTFASVQDAEAYSDKVGDAYFEICYHLEGQLNLCLKIMHDLYANGPATRRPKMQTGLVRGIICPEGWPQHHKTLVATLLACSRFRHEDTCHAYTIKEAMSALVAEKEVDGTLQNAGFDRRTLEPMTALDAQNARQDLLRLCDWIESRLHHGTHAAWYQAPICFSIDPDTEHLANIGIAQRNLAKFSERDRKRWEGIHERAAQRYQSNMKAWGTVGKMQHDPEPRTWTHPAVDELIIGLWPLVEYYNWTYTDLLKVLDKIVPFSRANAERAYPLDSEDSLKVHCRCICGLTKSKKGKSADKMPRGWAVATRILASIGK